MVLFKERDKRWDSQNLYLNETREITQLELTYIMPFHVHTVNRLITHHLTV